MSEVLEQTEVDLECVRLEIEGARDDMEMCLGNYRYEAQRNYNSIRIYLSQREDIDQNKVRDIEILIGLYLILGV